MMYTKFNELLEKAGELRSHLNTAWSEENSKDYDDFADEIESLYDKGELSVKDFNLLALLAFYDYDNLKDA